jgi:hypothetical protein
MADDIDEQVAEHIREILRLMIDVKGKTLGELNEQLPLCGYLCAVKALMGALIRQE